MDALESPKPSNWRQFNYTYQFDFETHFDKDAFHSWILEYWMTSFLYSGIYIVFIFLGQWYMKDRPRFELRLPLIIWSSGLALFSMAGASRTLPEFIDVVWNYGWAQSLCNNAYCYGPTAFWGYMFMVSKVYELGDTVFIVLRKQKLIFLHWYHHVTVMIYVFYCYTDCTAPGRWFCNLNYVVHSFMYSYYAAKALKYHVHRIINLFITTLQIAQMFVGIGVNFATYWIKSTGNHCQQTYTNMMVAALMYGSYLVFFLHFFHGTYIRPQARKVTSKVYSKQMTLTSNGMHIKKLL